MPAETTLLLGKSLFLLALGTAAIHLAVLQIVFKKQAAAGAFDSTRLDAGFTTRQWAFEDCLALIAPVIPF